MPEQQQEYELATSSQRRDVRPNTFQLLPQLHPNPILQFSSRLSLTESTRRRDLAVRHILPVGFRPGTGAVRERASTNVSRAAENFLSDANK